MVRPETLADLEHRWPPILTRRGWQAAKGRWARFLQADATGIGDALARAETWHRGIPWRDYRDAMANRDTARRQRFLDRYVTEGVARISLARGVAIAARRDYALTRDDAGAAILRATDAVLEAAELVMVLLNNPPPLSGRRSPELDRRFNGGSREED